MMSATVCAAADEHLSIPIPMDGRPCAARSERAISGRPYGHGYGMEEDMKAQLSWEWELNLTKYNCSKLAYAEEMEKIRT